MSIAEQLSETHVLSDKLRAAARRRATHHYVAQGITDVYVFSDYSKLEVVGGLHPRVKFSQHDGVRLLAIRLQHDMTQAQMATMIGLNTRNYRALENGAREVTPQHFTLLDASMGAKGTTYAVAAEDLARGDLVSISREGHKTVVRKARAS